MHFKQTLKHIKRQKCTDHISCCTHISYITPLLKHDKIIVNCYPYIIGLYHKYIQGKGNVVPYETDMSISLEYLSSVSCRCQWVHTLTHAICGFHFFQVPEPKAKGFNSNSQNDTLPEGSC